MHPLLTLAVRNVARSKARSAITIGAITFGILMTLLLGAVIHGMHRYLVDDTVKGRVGAIQVHARGYLALRDRQPLKLDLDASGRLAAAIERVPGVAAVSPRLVFAGMVSNGSAATLVTAQGVDLEREKRVLPWSSQVGEGAALAAGATRSAVLSTELARALSVSPGAALTFQATTQGGKENALDVELVGALGGSLLPQNRRLAYVPLAYAQDLLRMPGRATEYVVAVEEGADVDRVAGALRAALDEGLEVHTWSELMPAVPEAMAIQRGILLGLGALFLVIAVIGVANTLLMSVMERTREIGTMMAVGVRRGRIATLFVLEAAVQALLGGAAGVALAYGLVGLMLARGGLTLPINDTLSFTLLPEVAPYQVAVAVVAATLGAVLAAVSPALRAARLRPVEALRGA
jgi:putative ABC transport system permease protein